MPTIAARLPIGFVILAMALLMNLIAGCAGPAGAVEAPVPVAEGEYRPAFETAVATLRDHGFVIDRQDYRFGRITTKPRFSPNLVEFWNRDNTTASQSLGASLNNEQRTATIKLDRAQHRDSHPPVQPYELSVEVAIERITDPDRRLTGSTSSINIVRPLSETPAQFERQGVHGKAMVFIERDEHFEQRLLADIRQRLADIRQRLAAKAPGGGLTEP